MQRGFRNSIGNGGLSINHFTINEQLLVADSVLSKVLSSDVHCTNNIVYLDGSGGKKHLHTII